MKLWKAATGSVVIMLIGSGAGYAAWHNSDAERAKRDVTERLVDPESAIFSDIESCKDGQSLAYVTGLVNSRNSMGGMTGKQRFIARALESGFSTHIESGDQFDQPNFADKFVKARDYTASHPMPCKRVEDLASAEYNGSGVIDPANPPLIAADGLLNSVDTMSEDEITANISLPD